MKFSISDNLPLILYILLLFLCITILGILEYQKNEFEFQCNTKGGLAIKTLSDGYACIKAKKI